jgi:uncharacterized protein YqeY
MQYNNMIKMLKQREDSEEDFEQNSDQDVGNKYQH